MAPTHKITRASQVYYWSEDGTLYRDEEGTDVYVIAASYNMDRLSKQGGWKFEELNLSLENE